MESGHKKSPCMEGGAGKKQGLRPISIIYYKPSQAVRKGPQVDARSHLPSRQQFPLSAL
jgi:hypothetical protein